MLSQIEKWKIEQLAGLGFSLRAITAAIKNKPFARVSKRDLGEVGYYKSYHRIRLRDYRDMRTGTAREIALRATKPPQIGMRKGLKRRRKKAA